MNGQTKNNHSYAAIGENWSFRKHFKELKWIPTKKKSSHAGSTLLTCPLVREVIHFRNFPCILCLFPDSDRRLLRASCGTSIAGDTRPRTFSLNEAAAAPLPPHALLWAELFGAAHSPLPGPAASGGGQGAHYCVRRVGAIA